MAKSCASVVLMACSGLLTIANLKGCSSRHSSNQINWDVDYGLTKRDRKPYQESLEAVEHNVFHKSSLPLLIDSRGTTQMFANVPKQAQPVWSSRFPLNYRGCYFHIQTGPIIVDQFLWANQWIKYKLGIPANSTIVIENEQSANVRVSMDLWPVIKPIARYSCKNAFQGSRVLLGVFDVGDTFMGALPGPGSPQRRFSLGSSRPPGVKVYLNWPKAQTHPQLLDEFGVPVSVMSPIQTFKPGRGASYYLVVYPRLGYKGPYSIQPYQSQRPQNGQRFRNQQ